MSDYADTCSMCGQLYETGLDQEKELSKLREENEKLKKLVRSAYSEGYTDGMSNFLEEDIMTNFLEEDLWTNSSTMFCLKYDF